MIRKISILNLLVTCAGIVNADTYTWSGAAGDNMWGNSQNWTNQNGYYPQSDYDSAVINPGNEVIIWSSTQTYHGATNSIELGAGNTIIFEANNGASDLKVSAITLGGGAKFELTGTNAIGYNRDFTINYGTFTADSYGQFDVNMTAGTLWTNGKTITLTGNFDTSGLTGSGEIVLYDASGLSYNGGGTTFDVSGITLNTSEKVTAEIITRDNKVAISYQVVPEPATATLSLLALCGLAARRRRK